MNENARIVLVDLSGLFYAAWHVTTNDQNASNAVKLTLDAVSRLRHENPDSLIGICCDGKGSWRKQLAAEYKANRPKGDEALYTVLGQTIDRLIADGYLVWKFDGFEADDVIATATKLAVNARHPVTVASADKDLLQLVSDVQLVNVRRTHNWETYTEATVIDRFGVVPASMGDFLALVGDASDNVAGIEGVGGKCAAAILGEFGNLATFCDEITKAPTTLAKIPKLSRWKTVLSVWSSGTPEALADKIKALKLSRRLVSLSLDVPLSLGEIFVERKPKPMPDDWRDDDGMGTVVDVPPAADDVARKTPTNEASATVVETTPINANDTKAIALREKDLAMAQFDENLQPKGMRALYWLANRVIGSRNYGKFANNADSALMCMLRGRAFGIDPATSVEIFHIIDGKPYPPAYLLLAAARKHKDCEYFYVKSADSKSATVVTRNRTHPTGHECSLTYTIEQAETAGLVKAKSGWEKNAEDMLVARAVGKLARREYSDATLGAHAFEEMENDPTAIEAAA